MYFSGLKSLLMIIYWYLILRVMVPLKVVFALVYEDINFAL